MNDTNSRDRAASRPLLRAGLFIYAGILFIFAAGFYFGEWWAVDFWPFAYSAGMSFFFVSSILAAAGMSILYCAAARAYRAMVGVGIDAAIITLPLAILAFASGQRSMRGFAIVTALTAVAGVLAALWFRRFLWRDQRPTPMLVRISFGIFIAALWIFGGALATGAQNILPWGVSPEVARVYGWTFLGASSYFLYGLIVPRWQNAAGQLLGFLAYDLVLIVPFVRFFSQVEPDRFVNHVVYTTVVVFSALLAVWYCFIDRRTRLMEPWQRGRSAVLAADHPTGPTPSAG